jgi:hypothetical protein
MNAIENIILMALLLALGATITVSVLIGYLYYLEAQDD